MNQEHLVRLLTASYIVLYELPWQFGLCAFACYLFGIAHTVSHVNIFLQKGFTLMINNQYLEFQNS
jgi:hypothetical protein